MHLITDKKTDVSRSYNLKIHFFDTESRVHWFIGCGHGLAEALDDAFNNYPGLRGNFQNLVSYEVLG